MIEKDQEKMQRFQALHLDGTVSGYTNNATSRPKLRAMPLKIRDESEVKLPPSQQPRMQDKKVV